MGLSRLYLHVHYLTDVLGGLALGAAVLILDSLVGSWLLRSQGRLAWRRFSETLASGRPPAREVIDGGLILLGGAFLLTPGFLTDLLGLALLLPPTRAMIRRVLARRIGGRMTASMLRARRAPRGRDHPYDVESTARDV